MTPIGPALRRFNDNFRLAVSEPLALWLATELPDASGGIVPDPFTELVADVELEGNSRIGAVACPLPHGIEDGSGRIAAEPYAASGPCPACGAAL